MANRLRQTVQSIEGTPAEQRMDMGGPAPDLTKGLAGSLQFIAEMVGPQADIAAMVEEARRAGSSFSKGDYLDAAGSMGLAAVAPLMIATPGSVKNVREISEGAVKGLRSLLKTEELMPFTKVKEDVSLKKIFNKDDKDIEQWKKDNKNPLAGERRYRDEELEKAARELNEGRISVEQFVKIRDERKPLKTYGSVPEQYDNFDILAALGKKVEDKGIVGVNVNIPQGKRTTSRFDINAYNTYDRYIVAVGDAKTKKVAAYSPTAVLKNVNFNYKPQQSFGIAQGKSKSPFATMEGDWQDINPESAKKYAESVINKDEWTEVGFDPSARLSFYNRATGEPVFNADEVIQVGPMVLAKGIKKPTPEQLEKLTVKTASGKELRYEKGGMIERNPYNYQARAI
jgi:hypothetical protein